MSSRPSSQAPPDGTPPDTTEVDNAKRATAPINDTEARYGEDESPA
jgi:hypothetical protein